MIDGRVLYARQGDVHLLRYVGDVRYPLTPSIDAFVNTLFERDGMRELVVDLSAADSVDSTNLGELARIARRLSERGARRPVMISTRPSLTRVLRSMSMDEVYEFAADGAAEFQADDDEIDSLEIRLSPRESGRSPELRRLMLAAHRSLMEMSDDNRERFHDVVAMLESQGKSSPTHNA